MSGGGSHNASPLLERYKRRNKSGRSATTIAITQGKHDMKLDARSSEFYLLLVVSLLSLAANMPNLIGEFIDQRTLLIVLSVVVVIALLRYLRLLLFLCVTALAIGANLPERLSKALGLSTDVMLGFLVLIVLIALLNRFRFLRLPAGAEEGAATKLDDEETRKAILIAISIGNIKRLRWLIKHNLEINFTHNGVSPVVAAAEKGNSEIMQLLVYHGVDLAATNAEGKTPLEIAETLGFTRTAEIIKFALDNKSASLTEAAPIKAEDVAGQGAIPAQA